MISLLGPTTIRQPKNTEYADYYRTIVGLMKEHDVRRIYAMGTIYIYQAEDHGSFIRFLGAWITSIFAPGMYHNIIAIQKIFENEQTANDIEWAVHRVGNIPGSSDAWSVDREQGEGEAYAGPIGAPGWSIFTNRSVLARWLVDAAESAVPHWNHQFPAVMPRSLDRSLMLYSINRTVRKRHDAVLRYKQNVVALL
ncbi:hypothetical protein B7494_g7671 [Chlorociboria aeruginascens]|nr:hypothetical protein B7494_g7671 [Chlorociboria aeruginascens]